MRQKTITRLLKLLQQDHAKLKARNNADFLGDYYQKEKEIEVLFQEWNLAKGNHQLRDELVTKIGAARIESSRLWRAWEKQTKTLESSVKEEYALQYDIEELQAALSSVRITK